ncbi:MAG TPA: hybrid sensor histidine kinase/response regulator [Gammaproteobacteria bacterium]
MADRNNELLQRLLATFRIEADEYVKAMSSGLLALEKMPAGPERAELVESIFRQAHSLKGAARAVKLTQIEAICQPLEDVFASLKDRKLSLSTPLADLLHKAVNLIEALAQGDAETARARQPEITAMIRQLERTQGRRQPAPADAGTALMPDVPKASAPAAVAADRPAGTVRVSTQKLDSVMRLAEELLAPRLAAKQRIADIQRVAKHVDGWRRRTADIHALIRPLERGLRAQGGMSRELRRLLDYFGEEQIQVRALQDDLASVGRAADQDRRFLDNTADRMQGHVREMQLLPCASMLDMFARLARELARDQGKSVDLVVQGSDIEVDRRLLEELKDPLVHLVRNSIDHGIEKPADRQKAGKPAQGAIRIAVVQKDSGKITLTISDDGAGIDIERLKALAIERGMLAAADAARLNDDEALDLVFRSGLSTSPLVTDVSGRGLGLAIARDKVEQLGGRIGIESRKGAGTTFRLVLPINLATFRGTRVAAGNREFIVPSASVERVARIRSDAVQTVNNRETIGVDGEAMALVWLHDVLELPRTDAANEDIPVIILAQGKTRTAFRIDAVTGEQEVLVKKLGPQLRRVRNVTGASVLGSGKVVPVLNVADLLLTAQRKPSPVTRPTADASVDQEKRSILVAEDSITSRSLLKNILEAAGFEVVTAVDGIDAYTTLKTRAFDLVISDVDMPRLNGFELTARLRADRQLGDLPVILVTTLDSREHRERGVDVGANAYIVKSSFDQSNLLDVVRRLI